MNDIIEDILSLKIKPHLDKPDYLLMLASSSDDKEISNGVKNIANLSKIIKKRTRMRSSENSMSKSNKLASFLNELFQDKDNYAGKSTIETMVQENKHTAKSLEITLLHNAIAKNLGLSRFEVYTAEDYYAPYFKDGEVSYSIFLKNSDNHGNVFRFRDAKVISNLEALARYVKKRSEDESLNENEKLFLENYSKELTRIDEEYRGASKISKPIDETESEYGKFRKKMGLSMKEVAIMIGKGKTTYIRYEKGRVTPTKEIDLEIRYNLHMPIEFESVSEEYRFYRSKTGISNAEVAKKLGMSESGYSNYELNRSVPSASTDDKIRKILNIPGRYLFSGAAYKNAREKLGLSGKKVAELIGKNESTYRDYEHNRVIPNIYVAKKLAKTLKLESIN